MIKTSHANSCEAYKTIKLTKHHRYQIILSCYLNADLLGLTDREIKNTLDYDDMNTVRPRITELLQSGYLKEVNSAIENGRPVRSCRITDTGKIYLIKTK